MMTLTPSDREVLIRAATRPPYTAYIAQAQSQCDLLAQAGLLKAVRPREYYATPAGAAAVGFGLAGTRPEPEPCEALPPLPPKPTERPKRIQPPQQNPGTPLSVRQMALLTFISEYVRTEGTSPTIREMMEACDIPSTSIVDYNLNRLVAHGYIVRSQDGRARGVRIVRLPGQGAVRLHVTPSQVSLTVMLTDDTAANRKALRDGIEALRVQLKAMAR